MALGKSFRRLKWSLNYQLYISKIHFQRASEGLERWPSGWKRSSLKPGSLSLTPRCMVEGRTDSQQTHNNSNTKLKKNKTYKSASDATGWSLLNTHCRPHWHCVTLCVQQVCKLVEPLQGRVTLPLNLQRADWNTEKKLSQDLSGSLTQCCAHHGISLTCIVGKAATEQQQQQVAGAVQRLGMLVLLRYARTWCPAPTLGGAWPPRTPCTQTLSPSSGLNRYLHTQGAYTFWHIYIK